MGSECVLRKLGYTAQKAKPGSTESFFNPRRSPNVVSFREPHPGDSLRQPELRDYLRKLLLSADEFIQLLERLLERARKRQLVAVRIEHMEIAFSPGGVLWDSRIESSVFQMSP